jgi:hypothetical protein
VISPAPELLAPAAAASIGRADSSRKKLVSEVNSARNVRASGKLRSRAGASSWVAGRARVNVLIARTVEGSRPTGKVRFYGD